MVPAVSTLEMIEPDIMPSRPEAKMQTFAAPPRKVAITLGDPVPQPVIVPLAAPMARVVAVSDSLGVIAVAHRPIKDKLGTVSIFGIDAQGKSVSQPAPPAPPAPAPVAGAPAPPLGAAPAKCT